MPAKARPTSFPALLQELRDQCCPTRLMAGSNPSAIVPVEIFVEPNIVSKIRIGLEFLRSAPHRPQSRVLISQKDSRQAAGKPCGHFPQIHVLAGAGRELHFEIVPVVMAEALQRFDQ